MDNKFTELLEEGVKRGPLKKSLNNWVHEVFLEMVKLREGKWESMSLNKSIAAENQWVSDRWAEFFTVLDDVVERQDSSIRDSLRLNFKKGLKEGRRNL